MAITRSTSASAAPTRACTSGVSGNGAGTTRSRDTTPGRFKRYARSHCNGAQTTKLSPDAKNAITSCFARVRSASVDDVSTADAFDDLFRRVTGHLPYDYQRALAARSVPPAVIQVPTGAGKTLAVLLAWLFDPEAPLRLVIALPMRSLVEQTATVARATLEQLGEPAPVRVLMGGAERVNWMSEDADRRAVIVGTIDMLVSAALNRGYSHNRFSWPVPFGLLNNDCRWVCDETQLMGPARITTAQLAGLRDKLGVHGRCETVWMSATIDRDALRTVDRPDLGDVLTLSGEDRCGPLRERLEAEKRVHRLDLAGVSAAQYPQRIAAAVSERHRPGTRTIVVVNRVDTAQTVEAALTKLRGRLGDARVVLLHSRFRPPERLARMGEALAEPAAGGTIVVSTQVIEAGVDVSSTLLATETAPFSSIVQRLGRCNRAGDDQGATVLWLDRGPLGPREAAPYPAEDIEAARHALLELEGESASPTRLEQVRVAPEQRETPTVLRRRDLLDLFDTAPDLSGSDIDIAPYIRADDERTVSVFFRSGADGVLSASAPEHDELVSVPVGAVADFAPRRFDIGTGEWYLIERGRRPPPGSVLLLAADGGGYDARRGWTGRSQDRPEPLAHGDEQPESIEADPSSIEQHSWVSVSEHLADTQREALELTRVLELDREHAAAVVEAAALHDIGKAHAAFQEMLTSAAESEDPPPATGGPWAKSAHRGGRHVRRHFRHELASALALHDRDALVRYLVAAHHGRVRMAIRPAPGEEHPNGTGRLALGVVEGDLLPEVSTPIGPRPATTLSLTEMELGGDGRSWTALASDLRDTYGPFVLAYLEALVRVADWRASA